MVQFETEFYKKCDDIIQEYKKNEKEGLTQFLKHMETITIQRINQMENLIVKMFNYPELVDKLCTPMTFPDASKLKPDDVKQIPKVLHNFFMQKQGIMNERLKKYTETITEDILFFNLEEIKTRIHTVPKNEIYKNYMDKITATEYLKFLDSEDEILK
jgi:hypothetical protein